MVSVEILKTKNYFDIISGNQPPKWTQKKSIFWRLKLGCYFFWYQEIIKMQISWHRFGVPPSRGPPNGQPKYQLFEWFNFGCQFFCNQWIFKRKIFWCGLGVPPLPLGDPYQNQFFERLRLRCQCFFDISRHLRDEYLGIVWGCPPRDHPNKPPKTNFLNCSG